VEVNKMVQITHLYFGTAGAAGLYTHRIYMALAAKFAQDCVVNYYFPFDYGRRYFFKYTELSGKNIFNSWKYLRFSIRYVELVVGLMRSTVLLSRNRSKLVNYNLISQHYVEYLFLKFWKWGLKKRIMITLHDVVPFAPQYKSFFSATSSKQKIIDLADFVLVHNKNSIEDFYSTFKHSGKVVQHSFPVMDLRDIFGAPSKDHTSPADSRPYTFLFVGHPRIEKGLDVLVKAWKQIDSGKSGCRLIVASNIDKRSAIFAELDALENVEILPMFVSDRMYFDLISSSDCVLLPYKRGTNSGIPGSVLSLGVRVLCSDIPMFKNNVLISDDSFFETENPEAMARKMLEILAEVGGRRAGAAGIDADVREYNRRFEEEVISLYDALI
jgi:glycosyltransferase involved in cell wall biosynthesis